MTEEQAGISHKVPYEHYCQHPGCTKWGGWGFERGRGVTDWRCYEHRTKDHMGAGHHGRGENP